VNIRLVLSGPRGRQAVGFARQFLDLISRMIDMARATDIFDFHADAGVKEVKSWFKSKGVRDLEPVSLFSDSLAKVWNRRLSRVTFHSKLS
jgi:Exoribonuclease 1 Domain-3